LGSAPFFPLGEHGRYCPGLRNIFPLGNVFREEEFTSELHQNPKKQEVEHKPCEKGASSSSYYLNDLILAFGRRCLISQVTAPAVFANQPSFCNEK
jgi:hypothetical protein